MLLLLIILPFWTSFLVRVFAWKVLLHPEGPLKHALAAVGLIGPDTLLLYNEKAILLVMVYTFLPFAILPIYAAAESSISGCSRRRATSGRGRCGRSGACSCRASGKGLLTAVLVVFIPALGSYVIPDIVGGPNSEMIGNKIARRTFSDRNLPHASGLSAFLTLGVLLPLLLVLALQRKKGEEAPPMQEVS